MNKLVDQDSIMAASDSVMRTTEADVSTNWWMWIALIELGVIAFYLLNKKIGKNKDKKNELKKEALGQRVDFENIVNSSFHSVELYDQLKVKCHPDRFPLEKEKQQIAETLFQEIVKNKTNYKGLSALKEEAIKKLNIYI